MEPQDTPHIDRMREIAKGQVRWFEAGAPLKMSMIDQALREEGLIFFDEQGWIVLTPAALKIIHAIKKD